MSTRNQTIALVVLGLIALVCVILGGILALDDTTIPEFLVGTGGVAVGGIAGIAMGKTSEQ